MIAAKDVPPEARGASHRHYKGGWYELLGFAQHTETGEALILYRHVWPHINKRMILYARPLTSFYSWIEDPPGNPTQLRFEPVELILHGQD